LPLFAFYSPAIFAQRLPKHKGVRGALISISTLFDLEILHAGSADIVATYVKKVNDSEPVDVLGKVENQKDENNPCFLSRENRKKWKPLQRARGNWLDRSHSKRG
jgi:hypothetical protein